MHGGGEQLEYVKVQDLVKKYFKKADDKNKMIAITEKGLSDAIQEYIEKDEKDAISELINYQIEKIQNFLKKEVKWQNEFQLEEEIRNFQKMRVSNVEEEEQELKEIFEKTRKNTQLNQRQTQQVDSDEEVPSTRKKATYDSDEAYDIDAEVVEKPTSGRGRGSRGGSTRARGRGSRGSRGGRGAKAVVVKEEESFFSSSSRVPLAKKQPTYLQDSDPEIIDLDEDNKMQSKTQSKLFNQPVKTMSTSVRRARIDYDDDKNENGENNSKKSKLTDSKLNEDDDIPNTFSIFKKVAKKK